MGRWEPHAKQRLERAALDLFGSRGYDATTVGDIAAQVGVTSRTYFRYFPDKREILFANADTLRERIGVSLRDAPPDLDPLAASLYAMAACEEMFRGSEAELLRRRDVVIAGSGELREREARKLASIAETVASGLVGRGSEPAEARFVGDLSVAVFQHASRLWMDNPQTSFAVLLRRAAEQAGRLFA